MACRFRVRFKLGRGVRIHWDEDELLLAAEGSEGPKVVLKPRPSGTAFRDAGEIVLTGGPFETEQAARESANRWGPWLRAAFARLNIGADFGTRAPTGGFTRHGLQMLEQEAERPVLNDVHGAMVYVESDPAPLFASAGPVSAIIGKHGDRLAAMVNTAARLDVRLTERQELAYDLYSASFSEESADARFVMLMMALETLLEPRTRSEAAVEHVDGLISATRGSALPPDEIESIVGSLRWLRSESIGQAGRRLAQTLGDRRYADELPAAFFGHCYALRSDLVHGKHPRPERSEVGRRAAALERFVADLLSGSLLDEPEDWRPPHH